LESEEWSPVKNKHSKKDKFEHEPGPRTENRFSVLQEEEKEDDVEYEELRSIVMRTCELGVKRGAKLCLFKGGKHAMMSSATSKATCTRTPPCYVPFATCLVVEGCSSGVETIP
jgi:hypothetical protein